MHLTTIRYVVTVANFENITKAAQFLFISQPALSQAIRRLEKELHVQLFVREHDKVTLTPAGHVFVQEGVKLLELEEAMLKKLEEFQQRRERTLAIGSAPTYQRFYLSKVLSAYQAKYPWTKIILKDGFSIGLYQELLTGKLDIALAAEPAPKGIFFMPVLREEVFLAVPREHSLVRVFSTEPDADSPYPVADLTLCRDADFIATSEGRAIRMIFMQETQRAGFMPKILTTCTGTESLNTMVFHGLGLAMVPSTTVNLCPRDQRPRYYRLRHGGLFRTFGLARKNIAFVEWEVETFFAMARVLQ